MIPTTLRPVRSAAAEATFSNTTGLSPAKTGRATLRRIGRFATCVLAAAFAFGSASCSSTYKETRTKVVVSVKDQSLAVYQDGVRERSFPVSTSKFGLGDQRGSNKTPLGTMYIAEKIGDGAPLGAVFKSRRRTGEILRPNAPGRDSIVSRILWLKGTEDKNRNSFSRYIYIHGTVEERNIGQPVSYGCIRMRSTDVAGLFHRVPRGSTVEIIKGGLPDGKKSEKRSEPELPPMKEPRHPVENVAHKISDLPCPDPEQAILTSVESPLFSPSTNFGDPKKLITA